MNLTITRGVWLLDVMTYFACAIALAQAAEPQKKKAKQEAPALKQARQEEATASECWDTAFASQFLRASYTFPQVQYGTEASDCAFTSASYSTL